jgi:hypothetical protein
MTREARWRRSPKAGGDHRRNRQRDRRMAYRQRLAKLSGRLIDLARRAQRQPRQIDRRIGLCRPCFREQRRVRGIDRHPAFGAVEFNIGASATGAKGRPSAALSTSNGRRGFPPAPLGCLPTTNSGVRGHQIDLQIQREDARRAKSSACEHECWTETSLVIRARNLGATPTGGSHCGNHSRRQLLANAALAFSRVAS